MSKQSLAAALCAALIALPASDMALTQFVMQNQVKPSAPVDCAMLEKALTNPDNAQRFAGRGFPADAAQGAAVLSTMAYG